MKYIFIPKQKNEVGALKELNAKLAELKTAGVIKDSKTILEDFDYDEKTDKLTIELDPTKILKPSMVDGAFEKITFSDPEEKIEFSPEYLEGVKAFGEGNDCCPYEQDTKKYEEWKLGFGSCSKKSMTESEEKVGFSSTTKLISKIDPSIFKSPSAKSWFKEIAELLNSEDLAATNQEDESILESEYKLINSVIDKLRSESKVEFTNKRKKLIGIPDFDGKTLYSHPDGFKFLYLHYGQDILFRVDSKDLVLKHFPTTIADKVNFSEEIEEKLEFSDLDKKVDKLVAEILELHNQARLTPEQKKLLADKIRQYEKITGESVDSEKIGFGAGSYSTNEHAIAAAIQEFIDKGGLKNYIDDPSLNCESENPNNSKLLRSGKVAVYSKDGTAFLISIDSHDARKVKQFSVDSEDFDDINEFDVKQDLYYILGKDPEGDDQISEQGFASVEEATEVSKDWEKEGYTEIHVDLGKNILEDISTEKRN